MSLCYSTLAKKADIDVIVTRFQLPLEITPMFFAKDLLRDLHVLLTGNRILLLLNTLHGIGYLLPYKELNIHLFKPCMGGKGGREGVFTRPPDLENEYLCGIG